MQFVRDVFADLHPLPVFVSPGNHDWFGAASLYQRADWTPNVHIFKSSSLTPAAICDGLTLWGAAHRAPAGTAGFLDDFRVRGEGVHLALFHGSERGWFSEQGQGKGLHAPFDAAQIASAGLQHAFLGHYHRAKAAATHTYPGNPCPLTFGEEAGRGAVVITLEQDGALKRESRDVAACSVEVLAVDITGCDSRQDVRNLLTERLQTCSGFVRVELFGELPPQAEIDPQILDGLGGHLAAMVVSVEQVRVAYDLDKIAQEQTVRGEFVRSVRSDPSLQDGDRYRVLVTGLRALAKRRDLEVR
jgi:exonuclease SbcD